MLLLPHDSRIKPGQLYVSPNTLKPRIQQVQLAMQFPIYPLPQFQVLNQKVLLVLTIDDA